MPPKAQVKIHEEPQPDTMEDQLKIALQKLEEMHKKQMELEKRLEEKEETLQEAKEELQELTKEQEGWLIKTPNPVYDGTTMGIKFNSGLAFIPSNLTFPKLGGKRKDKEGKMVTFVPDARMVAKELENDFGYEIRYYSYEDMKALKAEYATRKGERAAAEEAMKLEQEKNLRKLGLFQEAR